MKDVSSGSPQNCRSPSSYFDCGSHKALLRKTNLKSLQSPVKATVSHASGKNHVSPFSETCGHGVASSGMRLWQEIETTLTMKINALNSFETSETTDPTTPRHIQEHLNLQQHSCETSHIVQLWLGFHTEFCVTRLEFFRCSRQRRKTNRLLTKPTFLCDRQRRDTYITSP